MQRIQVLSVVLLGTCAFAPSTALEPVAERRIEVQAAESAYDRAALAPARWIENRGQWPEAVEFAAQLPGAVAWVERGAIVLAGEVGAGGEREVVRLVFDGADRAARWLGTEAQEGRFHFFLGDDPERWTRNAQSFARLSCKSLYPGVDLELHMGSRGIKYDLLFAPHAALGEVVLRCEGGALLEAGDDGRLEARCAQGSLVQLGGASWQVLADGGRRPVAPRWLVDEAGRARLDVPGYDASLPLVVDPELVWSTYLGASFAGGQGDLPGTVALGPDGDAYLVGRADGWDFPQAPHDYQAQCLSSQNVFVTRFRASDGALVYSVLLGGRETERGLDVCVDALGQAAVVGWTLSEDFPATPGAFDSKPTPSGWTGFVSKLNAFGDDLLFSTLIEGDATGAQVLAVASSPDGGLVFGGNAYGSDFPVTPGAFDTTWAAGLVDAFVAKLDLTGSTLVWSTFLGGVSGDHLRRLAVAADGSVTAAGYTQSVDFPTTPGSYMPTKSSIWSTTGFVTRLTADGSALVWSSFLGADEFSEVTQVWSAAVDASGGVCVVGTTDSPNFPTTPGAIEEHLGNGVTSGSYILSLTPDGAGLRYSTYLAATGGIAVFSAASDASGVFTIAGSATGGIPVTPGAYDTSPAGFSDFFVGCLSPLGDRFFYASYVGGPESDLNTGVAVAPSGRVTVCGQIYAPGGYPTTPGAPFPDFIGGQSDAAITTFDLLLEGVREYGSSTPSCLGPIRIGVTEMPVAGARDFGLYASGAPPGASGELSISWAANPYADASVEDPLHLVDPSRLLARLPVTSDAFGFVQVPFPLRTDWTGRRLYAQFRFTATPDCPSPTKRCASFALEIQVQ